MGVDMQAIPFGEDAQAPLMVPGVLPHPALAAASANGAKLPGDRVLDAEAFFRTSQVADSLRDTAKLFLRSKTADDVTLSQMVADYESIRAQVGSLVDECLAEDTGRHCPTLAEGSSLEMILYASTQLCRWLDAILAAPSFLISERIKMANAHEVTTKVTQVLGDGTNGAGSPRPKNPGQYL
ncbi:MAG: hypothetical protein ACRDY7_17555 [Acidimicrobiia bacterium]